MPACRSCSLQNPEGFAFCGHCGAALASLATGAEVRKRISVVFCDLVGSTLLGERLDPESLGRVMTRYYDAMRAVLERHGSVGQFSGDGVMALFGVPKLNEDDALRAVRAAAEMSNAMATLNQELQRDWGVQLACRIAVNTGDVLTGDDLSPQRLVVGDALNTAARMQHAAGPGEVLLSEATYELVQHAVEVEEVPPLPLRGKTRAVRAFRLLAVNPQAPARASRRDTPMVGRDAERVRLGNEFESTLAGGSCRLVTVVGPAGIGKTRLVEEFTASLGARASVLRGRCLSYGQGVTFWALTDVIRQGADIGATDDEAQARRKILTVLADEPEARRICDGVTDVIGLSTTRAAPAEAFWSLRKFLEAKARSLPVVVFLEDLHWAESTFLDFIEHVAGSSRGVPLLILATARPELLGDRRDWATPPKGTAVVLPPLPPSASTALLENLSADQGLEPATRAKILEAAEGNPLFLEQMLLMFRDDEGLGRVPATVQAVLAARLDRLATSQRRFLEAAAVEGKDFEMEAVGKLLPEKTPSELAMDADELVNKELIEADGSTASQEAFRFRHILIRDVAYDSIPKQTRSELHARLAEWMDQADGSAEYDAIVGHHLERAYRYRAELRPVDDVARTLASRATSKLAKAGRGTLARGDAPAASNLLGRAAALVSSTDPLRPGLLLSLAAARRGQGDVASAAAALDEVLGGRTTWDDPRSYAGALLERGWLRLSMDPTGWAAEALSAAAEAVAVFKRIGDDRGLARAYELMTEVHFSQGQLSQCRADTEIALQHARRAGDLEAETNARMYLGGPIYYGDGTVREMIRFAGDNVRWQARNPTAWILVVSHGFGRAYAMTGEFDEARKVTKRDETMLEDLGQVGILAWTLSHVSAFIETLAGDHSAAERELRKSYLLLERNGAKNAVGAAARLAHSLCAQGRYEEAEHFAAITRDASPGDIQEQALWRSALAKVLAHRGNIGDAEKLAREATDLLEPTGFINQCGDAEMDLAEVLLTGDRAAEATIALEKALSLYRRKGNTVSAARAEELLRGLGPGHHLGND